MGTVMVHRVEEAGKAPYLRRTEFVEVGDEWCSFRVTMSDLDGVAIGQAIDAEVTWSELESHAHFPGDKTAIATERVETPFGHFAAKRYDVRRDQDGREVVSRMWFAPDLPGPPVKMAQIRDGEVIMSMILVHSVRPKAP